MDTQDKIKALHNATASNDLKTADRIFKDLLHKALTAQAHLERKLDDHGIAKDSPARLRIIRGGKNEAN
jgi:hypothetical protein